MNRKMIFCSTLLGLGALTVWAEPTLPAPVAWWKMDAIENGKVADASGNGHDLTVGAGCSVTNAAMTGNGVFWNGTQQAWGSFTCTVLRSQTLSLWYRRDRTDGPLDPSVNTYPYLFLFQSFRAHFNYDATCASTAATTYLPDNKTVNPAISVARGAWTHLAFVIEEKSFADGACTFVYRCYVNGVLAVENDTGRSFAPYALSPGFLGNNASNGTRPMHGIFDDARLFGAALTRGQVEELYNEGCSPRDGARLIGCWDLDDVTTESGVRKLAEKTGYASPIELEDGVAFTNGVDVGSTALWFNGTSTTLAKSFVRYPFQPSEVSFAAWLQHSPDAGTPPIAGNYYNRFCMVSGFFSLQNGNDNGHSVIYYSPNYTASTINGVLSGYGGWCHVAVCCKSWYDDAAGSYKTCPVFYRDGSLVCTGAVQTLTARPALTDGAAAYFGSAGDRNRVFHGAMCGMRLYAGMLTPEQVRDLACGPAKPDAGADFTVTADRARLCGRVADTANPKGGVRHGFAGTSRWLLKSCPAGGEAVEIVNPEAEATDVTLPVVGAYAFRLAVTSREGEERSDDVVVTRVAPSGLAAPDVAITAASGSAAPEAVTLTATATDPAGKPLRLVWRRVSGLGTVRFSSPCGATTEATFSEPGSYVLSCTAENGEASATATVSVEVASATISAPAFLSQGLIAHWGFDNGIGSSETLSGTGGAYYPDNRQCRLEPGVSGNGIATRFAFETLFNTGKALQEDGSDGQVPTSRWRTFSLWMYHDPAEDVSLTKEASLVFVANTLGIRYNCEGGADGFTLYHQTVGGSPSKMYFGRPAVDPKGRWTHVVAVFDRLTDAASNASELWIDGIRQTKTSGGLGKARKNGNAIFIGGMSPSANHDEWNGSFVINGVKYSRRFPGVIDEVRLYNRQLSAAEIGWLAAHPQIDAVTGPLVDGLPETANARKREPLTLSPVVSGATDPGADCKWEVVSGDASGLQIVDADKPSCTIIGGVAGTYCVRLSVTSGVRTTHSDVVTVVVTKRGTLLLIR